MIKGALADRARRLEEQRVPFVIATVVGAKRPTSVRLGDSAVVLGDGTIEGFVGGVCAESSVRLYSLRVLETGEPLLLRLLPGDGSDSAIGTGDAVEGAVVEHNPCLSGGALEIFLEPQLPLARIVIVGSSPIAAALEKLSGAAGYDVIRGEAEQVEVVADDAAVVVASHGNQEERVLSEALAAGVPYVALVASTIRGAAVRAALDVPEELRAQLHTPAGLAIGARTPVEIAVSILAELVAEHHAHPGPRGPSAAVAADPVCGMALAVTDATPQLELAGERVYFCSDRCREQYAQQHAGHGG